MTGKTPWPKLKARRSTAQKLYRTKYINYIAYFRNEIGMTQKELAKRLGLGSRGQISRIESAYRIPRWPLALRIAQELEKPFETVFRVKEEENEKSKSS